MNDCNQIDRDVRLARLEGKVAALQDDVNELKAELRAFRQALIRELRQNSKDKAARQAVLLQAMQPKTLIPLAIIIVSGIAAASGLAFSWGDFTIGERASHELTTEQP